MQQRLIPLHERQQWNEALKAVPHAFGHTWENCYAMSLSTGYNTFLYQLKDGSTTVVCPIAERVFNGYVDIVTPYGFGGITGNADYVDFQNCWKRFFEKRGVVCGYIGLNPLFENDTYTQGEHVHETNTIYILDLRHSLETVFQGLSQNRKRQVRGFGRSGAQIIDDKVLLGNYFLDHYHQFMSERNAASVYQFSEKTLAQLIGVKEVFLRGVTIGQDIVAVALFAYTSFSGEYLFSVSVPAGKHYTAALIWSGVKEMFSKNIPFLNLGGGKSRGDSIALFKERFGGAGKALRCLKQIYNPAVYKKLCWVEGIPENNMGVYFPAYRQP